MEPESDIVLAHEPERQRFVATVSDARAEGVLEYAALDDGRLDYRHTFVPPALRGRGIATRLVDFALTHALEQGIEVVPSCPFVAARLDAEPRFRNVDARRH